MLNIRRIRRLMWLAALALGLPTAALGQTVGGTLNVNASVIKNCLVNTTAVNFPNYDPLISTGTVEAEGVVSVRCTRGTTIVSVALGAGSGTGGVRSMGGPGGARLTYELYKPSDGTPNASCVYTGATVWGTSGANLFNPTGAAPTHQFRDYRVCGQMTRGQDVPEGSYTDSVAVTVTF